jgi:acetyl-CoA acyltransferase 1
MSIDTVGIDREKVNINGCVHTNAQNVLDRDASGAIAFGHPLGATGARQVATALPIAKRTGGKLIVTSCASSFAHRVPPDELAYSMCIGSGMGMASLIVNEQ